MKRDCQSEDWAQRALALLASQEVAQADVATPPEGDSRQDEP